MDNFPAMKVPEGFNQANVAKAWILTYSGKQFYHLNPKPEMVFIEDIAHALSLICRWTGHTIFHYSVAQHSVYCSYLVPREFALTALLHDASEAYLGDMNRPLKHYTDAGPAYMKVEQQIERVIFERFGLPFPMPECIKIADTKMLYTERDQVMNSKNVGVVYEARKWGYSEERADIQIQRWTPRRAEKVFLARFRELIKEQGNANYR